jgi:hypothetical protein
MLSVPPACYTADAASITVMTKSWSGSRDLHAERCPLGVLTALAVPDTTFGAATVLLDESWCVCSALFLCHLVASNIVQCMAAWIRLWQGSSVAQRHAVPLLPRTDQSFSCLCVSLALKHFWIASALQVALQAAAFCADARMHAQCC